MVLNTEKTKVLLVTTPQKRAKLVNNKLLLTYNNIELKLTTGDKILGMHIDEHMNWDNHIIYIRKKISTNIWLLSRIRSYTPFNYRIIFYKAYIQPHLDYCNIIWGNTKKANIHISLRLQRRACRTIFGDQYTTLNEALVIINSLNIEQRIFLQKAKFMYRVSQHAVPSYISDMFHPTVVSERNLRSANELNYITPRPNKELFKRKYVI